MSFLYQTFYNFRNLKNGTIDLSPKEIFFVGENGQGKSNILESLYYVAYGISFRTHNDSNIIKNGEKDFSINSVYKDGTNVQKVSVIYENNKKRIEKNNKKIFDRKELINTIPCGHRDRQVPILALRVGVGGEGDEVEGCIRNFLISVIVNQIHFRHSTIIVLQLFYIRQPFVIFLGGTGELVCKDNIFPQ